MLERLLHFYAAISLQGLCEPRRTTCGTGVWGTQSCSDLSPSATAWSGLCGARPHPFQGLGGKGRPAHPWSGHPGQQGRAGLSSPQGPMTHSVTGM